MLVSRYVSPRPLPRIWSVVPVAPPASVMPALPKTTWRNVTRPVPICQTDGKADSELALKTTVSVASVFVTVTPPLALEFAVNTRLLTLKLPLELVVV